MRKQRWLRKWEDSLSARQPPVQTWTGRRKGARCLEVRLLLSRVGMPVRLSVTRDSRCRSMAGVAYPGEEL